jgi:hypothetical protein
MVEPNPTNKERYSISFNSRVHHISSRTDRRPSQDEGVCPNEFTFELDALGNPIIN